jgi:hypothetical protein
MKKSLVLLSLMLAAAASAFAGDYSPPPRVFVAPTPPPPAAPAPDLPDHVWANPDGSAVAPPSAPAKRSAADLEKLVAPIALYPDPLLAVLLPASSYPLEIVQAARFVKDTNNLAKLDQQSWDPNVKAVARFPDVIAKLDTELTWTTDLGQAFRDQQLELMDAIQALRSKAAAAGTIKSTPEQNVIVTNAIVERSYQNQIIYVTNQVVQIEPASPQYIYVPQYNPAVVYSSPAVVYTSAPTYTVDPWVPLVTFGVGVALGAWLCDNHCNWWYGGVYCGGYGCHGWYGGHGCAPYYPPPYGCYPPHYYPPGGYYHAAYHYPAPYYSGAYSAYHPPPGYQAPPNTPVGTSTTTPASAGSHTPAGTASAVAHQPGNATANSSAARSFSSANSAATASAGSRWQPDQSRVAAAGAPAPSTSTRNFAQRGWGSAVPGSTQRPTTLAANTFNRSGAPTSWSSPTPGANTPYRAGSGASTFNRSGASTPSFNRPGTASSVGRSAATPNWSQPSGIPNSARYSPGSSFSRAPSWVGSRPSAFSGLGNGASAWSTSMRGAASRGGNMLSGLGSAVSRGAARR